MKIDPDRIYTSAGYRNIGGQRGETRPKEKGQLSWHCKNNKHGQCFKLDCPCNCHKYLIK